MMTDKRMRGGAATIRQRAGRACFLAAIAALASAAVVTLSGGGTPRVGGVAFISRTPLRPLLVAAALLIAARALLGAASFARARAPGVGPRGQRPARIAGGVLPGGVFFSVA